CVRSRARVTTGIPTGRDKPVGATSGRLDAEMKDTRYVVFCALVTAAVLVGACHKNKPPVARPLPPPPPSTTTGEKPPAPPEPVPETTPIPPEPSITDDSLAGKDLDVINKNSPFQPVFYALDSSELDQAGQQVLNANAEVLRKYPTWIITNEGHCDERGTAKD